MNLLITQVQKAISSGSKMQELNFNHPIKFLCSYRTDAADFVGTAEAKTKLQINGTDVGDSKLANPHYTSGSLYYHTPFVASPDFFLYPFCLSTSSLQPTGTLNFSRLSTVKLMSETMNIIDPIYAVNYNILRIENGMAGLLYAN